MGTKTPADKADIANCILDSGLLGSIEGDKTTNIENMRKFHNWIKSKLITKAVQFSDNESLLDLAVGRGGDILKWKNNNIDYVLGIDIDKKSIFGSVARGDAFDGAIARLKQMKIRKPIINFFYMSALDPGILNRLKTVDNGRLYSVVSCQFAMHYFAENNMSLNHIFNVIYTKLKPGGIFIATFSDGTKIQNNLENGEVNLPSLNMAKLDHNSYSFMLNATSKVQGPNYFEILDENKEYILTIDKIKEILPNYNMEIIENKDFYKWYKEYTQTPNYKELDFQEMLISFLNTSIIIKKVN